MANQMLRALMDEEKRGTLANPGIASPLGPTLSMKTGAFLHPLLQAAKDKFPKDNPRGRWLGEMLLGDSPQRTGRVAEGVPDQYFHYNRGSGSNVSPEIVDLAGALPIGSAFKLAKLAAPLAAPVAMATSAAALNRLKAPGYAATSTDDIGAALLGRSLQTTGDLNKAMVGGDAGAAALARIGNTAPQQAMELAEQMESAGRSRDEIWAATADMGYPVFRGPDGKLRFEIDDSAARTRGVDEPKVTRGAIWKAEDAIEHPEFYDMNPDARLLQMRDYPGQGGQYIPSEGRIEIGASRSTSPLEFKSTGLHELQHATQEAEGFARGGTPDEFIGQGLRDLLTNINDVKPLQDELLRIDIDAQMGKLKQDMGIDVSQAETAAMARADELRTQIDNMMARKSLATADPYDMYRALAGEAEARQVQARMDMSPAERAYKPFYADFDVPEADQIVRYGDGPSAMVTYQGSPHKFDALDPTKIGTGEGAQAYGHGAYVAESKDVAQTYQPRDFDAEEIMMAKYKEAEARGDYNRMEQWENAMLHETPDDLRERSLDMDYDEDYRQAAAEVAEELAAIPSTSHLYEIDVPDEDIAKMLDWDAPLSEQPESVREVLAAKGLYDFDADALGRTADDFAERVAAGEQVKNAATWMPGNTAWQELTGADFYRAMQTEAPPSRWAMKTPDGNVPMNVSSKAEAIAEAGDSSKVVALREHSPKSASNYLEELGIPGIKYYDEGSRAAGEGTRNMVLFDDLARRAKVLKRNDEAIAEPSVDEFIGKFLDDELPLDEASRMQRAREMGFDVDNPLYHATNDDFSEFDLSLAGRNTNEYASSPEMAETSRLGVWVNSHPLGQSPDKYGAGYGIDMPLYATKGKYYEIDNLTDLENLIRQGDGSAEAVKARLIDKGYDGIKVLKDEEFGNVSTVIFDPTKLRSKFAKFDPAKKDSAKLLAGAAGAGVLSGLYEPDALKDDEKMRRALLRN